MMWKFTIICVSGCGLLGSCDIKNDYMKADSKAECVENAKWLLGFRDKTGMWEIRCHEVGTRYQVIIK